MNTEINKQENRTTEPMGEWVPSFPRISEYTKLELWIELFCRTWETPPSLIHHLQNIKTQKLHLKIRAVWLTLSPMWKQSLDLWQITKIWESKTAMKHNWIPMRADKAVTSLGLRIGMTDSRSNWITSLFIFPMLLDLMSSFIPPRHSLSFSLFLIFLSPRSLRRQFLFTAPFSFITAAPRTRVVFERPHCVTGRTAKASLFKF